VLARFSVEERSLKIIMLAAVALFVVGAIAEARDTHTVWGQGGMFWMLLGFAAVALEFAVPRYAGRLHRR
jgi:predicted cobalt transporter CbtA